MEFSSPPLLAEQLPLPQLKTIIKEIGTIKKVRVENDEMDSIWDISADDIEKKKEICYMNPCIAQVLYTIKKLKEVYPAKTIFLGVEFLSLEQRNGFHFFIKIHYNNDEYIIDFSHDNCVFLYQGTYNNKNPKHTIISQGIIYTPATLITSTDSIFDLAKKIEIDVETLKQDISTHIQHLKKDNTLEAWEEFNAKKNGPLKIIDENIDFSDIAFYINDTLYTALFSNPETTLLHNFDTYKLEIHALLFQTPTKENQQQLFNYLTT